MKSRNQTKTSADRLNSAFEELKTKQAHFQIQKEQMVGEICWLREENQKMKTKYKDLKRQKENNHEKQPQLNYENEQIVLKLKSYIQKIQESSRQMSQVATQCKIYDVDIEVAASQIERNIGKAVNGVTKYLNELVRKWGVGEALRIQTQRLQIQNRKLFQLTTNLQHNFKQTDKYIKQIQTEKGDSTLINKLQQLQAENTRLRTNLRSPRSKETIYLEDKIIKMNDQIKRSQEQNATIKNIHQRNIKKLEKLQSREQIHEAGQGIQEERQRWLQKTEDMYEEMRKLRKELMLSEENQKKVQEELNRCLQIYTQWEEERDKKKEEIDELKIGIATYLKRINDLESNLVDKKNEIEQLQEQLDASEEDKQKIINVYQLQAQQLNDQLFKKQDEITQFDTIRNRQNVKYEDLKKVYMELTNSYNLQNESNQLVEENIKKIKKTLEQKQENINELQFMLKSKQQQCTNIQSSISSIKAQFEVEIVKITHEKAQILEVMQEFKDQYYQARKQVTKLKEDNKEQKQQLRSVLDELKNILGINQSQDLWNLIATLREKFKIVSEEVKTLKNSQKRYFEQSEKRQNELQFAQNKLNKIQRDLQSKNQFIQELENHIIKLQKAKSTQGNNYQLIQEKRDVDQKKMAQILSENKQLKENNIQLQQKLSLEQIQVKQAFSKMKELNKLQEAFQKKLQKEEETVHQSVKDCQQESEQGITKLTFIDQESKIPFNKKKSFNHEVKTEECQVQTQLDNNQICKRFQLSEQYQELKLQKEVLDEKIVGYGNTTKKIQELNQQIEMKANQLKHCTSELHNTKEQFGEMKAIQEYLSIKNEQLKSAVEQLNFFIKQKQSDIQNAVKEKESYAKRLCEIEELVEDIKREESNSEELKKQVETLQQVKQELMKALEALQQENILLNQDKSKHKSENQSEIKLRLSQSNINSLKIQVQKYEKKLQQNEKQIKNKGQANIQLKIKLQKNQQICNQLRQDLQQKEQKLKKCNNQLQSFKKLLIQNQDFSQEKRHLESTVTQLEKECLQLRDELIEKDRKQKIYRSNISSKQSQKQRIEDAYKQKCQEYDLLSKENDHIKSQIKRINKQKVIAEHDAAKHRCNFQSQQKAHKNLRQSEVQIKTSQTTDQMVRQLKLQVQRLKEFNSTLKEQFNVEKSRNQQNNNFSHLSRSQCGELPIQMLKGQIKTKSINIDCLQRQLKAKTQDFSKLERRVESLNDELNLQRKRVHNFQDLYQNIQAKKLKLLSSKQQQ